MTEPIAILILAAGASSRMRGRDKLLENIDGRPLLAHVAAIAAATGHPVYVTLPPDAVERREVLKGSGATILDVADAATGMASSFRVWPRNAPDRCAGVVAMLADMPEITTTDLNALIASFVAHESSRVIRASDAENNAGHPVVFPKRMFDDFATLSGDQGARPLLQGEDVVLVPLATNRAFTDLDTPEDWDNWRKSRENT